MESYNFHSALKKKVFFENETQCFVCLIIQQNPLSMFCVVSLVHLFLVVCLYVCSLVSLLPAQSTPCLMMITTFCKRGKLLFSIFLFSVRVEFIFNGQDWRSNYPHLTRVISFGCQHWKNHSKTEMFI